MRTRPFTTLVALLILIFPTLSTIQISSAATNSQKALALAISGCQRGGFDSYKYESLARIILNSSLQHRINTLSNGTFEETQIQLDSIQHIEESWNMAGTFDKKWSKLISSYESALRTGVSTWNNGEMLGKSLNAALVRNEAQINSLCKLANIESLSAAKKEKLSQKRWVLKIAGSLLPKVVKFQN